MPYFLTSFGSCRGSLLKITIFSLAVICSWFFPAHAAPAPSFAAAVGYTANTYSSTFDKSQVDMTNTTNAGYKWYVSRFFGFGVTSVSGVVLNSDASVTLENNGAANTGILSAGANPDGGWVGTAFGGGGYFEAVIKFNPALISGDGWPSWWSMSLEHMAQLPTVQWPGQAKGPGAQYYEHYMEPDIMEYDVAGTAGGKAYGAAIHDWSGIWPNFINKTQPWPAFVVTTPAATDFNQYHKFGMLWVPATASKKGSVQYYFDDQATTSGVSWTQYTNQAPTPAASMDSWTYGVLDQQHLVLILGSGSRGPMTVQSVNAWQKSDYYNGHDGKIAVKLPDLNGTSPTILPADGHYTDSV
ncbi:MAG: hypothetical protein PHC61_11795, partial [Chitinivibrionales bacterium]|nr:hypothetical protein [Chitinivibrionales bacterium]